MFVWLKENTKKKNVKKEDFSHLILLRKLNIIKNLNIFYNIFPSFFFFYQVFQKCNIA